MKSERFLQSKVGRRIFLLFIACALLPITVLSFVATTFVTRQMESHGRERLHQMAKSAGMELFRTIEIAADELMLIAGFISEDAFASRLAESGKSVERVTHSFRALELVSPDDGRRPILGAMVLPTAVAREVRAQLSEADVVLSVPLGASGAYRVYLATMVDRAAPGERMLVGEIRPGALRDLRRILPEGMELSILGPGQQTVVASADALSAPSREELRTIGRVATGQFDLTVGDRPHMASYWSVFFGPRYGSPPWTVVVSEPRVDSFAALRQFGRILPLFAVLCLMIVVLMSMSQIRKSMIPLRNLQQGTERIAQRRFDSKVVVRSGDEFESLADSFNAMAADLDRQFRALTTLAEIDRAILSTVDEERIVHTILDRIADHYACDCAAVALTDVGADRSMTVHVRWSTGAICDTVDRVALESDERWRLAAAPEGCLICEGPEIPAYLRELRSQAIEHCLVLPLLVRQGLAGCIALGWRARSTYREADLQDLRRLTNQAAVALSNARLVDELERTNWETLRALARAVDANSPWTAGHSERVTAMALRLGERLGLAEEELAVIHRGGLLHDIGKIGISSEILDKPAKLTAAEMAVMQSHPAVGARILEPISAYSREIPVVLHHHERFDGRGYPGGLAGEAIPRNARILAVADVFDALISERPYRGPWPMDQVLDHIRNGAGTHFDPQIVPVFLEMIAQEMTPLPDRNDAASVRALFDPRTAVPV